MSTEDLDKRVNEIQAILVKNYGRDATLDEYHTTIIRGILLANAQTESELRKVADLVIKNVNPKVSNYHYLSPKAAFMLKWGWGIWLILALLILGGVYVYTNTPIEIIPPALQGTIQHEDGRYYILKDDYSIVKDKSGKPIGIEIVQ